VVYQPLEKQLFLIFEYLEFDFKKYLDKHKHTLTPMQIKVGLIIRNSCTRSFSGWTSATLAG